MQAERSAFQNQISALLDKQSLLKQELQGLR
jgi:hypothetical protein